MDLSVLDLQKKFIIKAICLYVSSYNFCNFSRFFAKISLC